MDRLKLVLAFAIIFTTNAFSQRDYTKECEEVKKYSVSGKYPVICSDDYHHFNHKVHSSTSSPRSVSELKISEFNALHPGMAKTRYKDYQKIASLINKWDIIGITELLPLVGNDLTQNTSLVNYIEEVAPGKIQYYEDNAKELKIKYENTNRRRRKRSLMKRIEIAEKMIEFYKAELKKAKEHYRTPGYLKILNELHKLRGGKNWALILSPKGEAAKPTDTHELVGYFYRADLVKPKNNSYCKAVKTTSKPPYACIAKMGRRTFGQDKSDIFSRRPFMASFKAKSFSFTLLTSHVIYTSPDEPELIKKILQKSFGVNHWSDLSTGINGGNYARFAEVKITLDFIKKIRSQYREKDIIFMGDLNLNYKNKFWGTTLQSLPGFEVYIEEKTSLSKTRFSSNGTETNGLSNDFDHFLFDPSYTSECMNPDNTPRAKVESFYKGAVGRFVKRLYEVRTTENGNGTYSYNNSKYQRLLDRFVKPYETGELSILKIGNKRITINGRTHSVRGLVDDKPEIRLYRDFFEKRILNSQLKDETYYSYFIDILSDHMPIVLTCKI